MSVKLNLENGIIIITSSFSQNVFLDKVNKYFVNWNTKNIYIYFNLSYLTVVWGVMPYDEAMDQGASFLLKSFLDHEYFWKFDRALKGLLERVGKARNSPVYYRTFGTRCKNSQKSSSHFLPIHGNLIKNSCFSVLYSQIKSDCTKQLRSALKVERRLG